MAAAKSAKVATKKENKVGSTSPAGAIAVHLPHDDGEHHTVGFGNIRVIIVKDGSAYFAQGLEIDYAAQGSSIEEVKEHFERGLHATIKQHLKIYGNIKGLLQPAPSFVWQELVPEKTALHNRYWHISKHTIEAGALPYDGINYLVAAAAQQSAACE